MKVEFDYTTKIELNPEESRLMCKFLGGFPKEYLNKLYSCTFNNEEETKVWFILHYLYQRLAQKV